MQFYYIRHGQSANNAQWSATGSDHNRSEDPELTNLGIEQAKRVAQLLKHGNPNGGNGCWEENASGFGITHIYASMMVRAVNTGTIIAEELGLPLHAWEDIHETGGIFLEDSRAGTRNGLPGKNSAYFKEYYPRFVLPENMPEAGWWNNRPFEENAQINLRAQRFLNELLKRHQNEDDRVAVVSHGGFYNHIVSLVLGLSMNDGIWFRMNNTGVSRFDFHPGVIDVIYMNRLDFLPPEMVT